METAGRSGILPGMNPVILLVTDENAEVLEHEFGRYAHDYEVRTAPSTDDAVAVAMEIGTASGQIAMVVADLDLFHATDPDDPHHAAMVTLHGWRQVVPTARSVVAVLIESGAVYGLYQAIAGAKAALSTAEKASFSFAVEVRYCNTACVLAESGVGVSVVDPLSASFGPNYRLAVRTFEPFSEVSAFVVRSRKRPLSRVGEALLREVRVVASKTAGRLV